MATEDQVSNSNEFDSLSISDSDEDMIDTSHEAVSETNQEQEQFQKQQQQQRRQERHHQAARLAEMLMEEDDKEKSQLLWSKFTEEELNRYEMFRRSTFPKASIKRLMQSISGCSVSQNVVIAMSGIAKVFVGELVDEALKIQDRYGESGPIEPKHIREAHRVIKNRSDKTMKLQ